MEKPLYKLSQKLADHEDAVRALAVDAEGNVVSASEDDAAVLWKLKDGKYTKDVRMTGHDDCVISVCILEPTEKHPNGYIITGGYDNRICIYKTGETEPVNRIEEHKNAVSCLRKSTSLENAFFSSSWDATANLWDLDDPKSSKVKYSGKGADVWCVADLPNTLVALGTANDVVLIYKRDGEFLRTLKGHTNSVREICVIGKEEFLTCSHDTTIRHWNATSGTCLGSFHDHTDYVCSISALPEGTLAVSSGLDMAVRVWVNGQVEQVIPLPGIKVWSVRLLPNKDVAFGTLEGSVMIFTSDPERFADPDAVKDFEASLVDNVVNPDEYMENDSEEDKSEFGVPDVPGKKDGETRIQVLDQLTVRHFYWCQRSFKWRLKWDSYVGISKDVTQTNRTYSGKQFYNGVEYDRVFSVAVEDDAPQLKLPYNYGQDPKEAAEKFIADHQLEPHYLDQVVAFINDQTNSVVARRSIARSSAPALAFSSAAPVASSSSPQFSDPLTGGDRFLPGPPSPGSVFRKSTETKSPASGKNPITGSYIPLTSYCKMENGNLETIAEKLQQFNSKDEMKNHSLTFDQLGAVVKLANNYFYDAIENGAIGLLLQLLNWPDALLLPILDIARLAVLHKDVNDRICTEEVVSLVRRHLTKESHEPNQMLTYRLLANMFYHEAGEKLGLQHRDELIQCIKNTCVRAKTNTQVAMATYVLNLTLATTELSVVTEDKIAIVTSICELLLLFTEPEALFRILVGLGTLLSLCGESERFEMTKNILAFESVLKLFQTRCSDSDDKLNHVKHEIYKLICSE